MELENCIIKIGGNSLWYVPPIHLLCLFKNYAVHSRGLLTVTHTSSPLSMASSIWA